MRPLAALPRAGAVALSALVLSTLGGAAGLVLLDRQVEHQFSEAQAYAAGDIVDRLALLQQDEGDASLTQAVQRATQTAAPGQLFLLVDGQGRKLAGNLDAWPEGLGGEEDWRPIVKAGGGGARVITATFRDETRLLVGQSDDSRWALRREIGLSAAAVFVALAAALFGVAVVWGRLVGARLARQAETARAIAGGDRDARLPLAGRDDAFDEVAAAFNRMVDENLRLVGGLEAVTQSLAHDLRTPLMRMRHAIEAARAAPDGDARDAALERAEAEAERTVGIFTGLADLALAESGLSREAMAPARLDDIVQDVVELFEPLAEDHGHALTLEARPATLEVHRQLVMQAVGNLIANAIRHAPPGSPIEVAVGPVDGGAEVTVRDHGPGLTPAEAEAAVRPFVRLGGGEGSPDTGAGLGLGLAIVRATARLHDGALSLEPADPGLRARVRFGTRPIPTRDPASRPSG